MAGPGSSNEKADVPDRAWRGYWPACQFDRERPDPTQEALDAAPRTWKSIRFPQLETPWGRAIPSLTPQNGLSIELTWFRDDAPVGAMEPGIEVGIASSEGNLVRRAKHRPSFIGTLSGAGNQDHLALSFDPLPPDMDDYWIELEMGRTRAWLLIPYGLGVAPSGKLPTDPSKGEPRRLVKAGPADTVLAWRSVEYDLGLLPGGEHVSVSAWNPFDGEATVTLHREGHDAWSFERPRTTLAIGRPEGSNVFSSLRGITRAEDGMRRIDEFKLFRAPTRERSWGLLRVTVEESALDVAVPSSVFGYLHGRIGE